MKIDSHVYLDKRKRHTICVYNKDFFVFKEGKHNDIQIHVDDEELVEIMLSLSTYFHFRRKLMKMYNLKIGEYIKKSKKVR